MSGSHLWIACLVARISWIPTLCIAAAADDSKESCQSDSGTKKTSGTVLLARKSTTRSIAQPDAFRDYLAAFGRNYRSGTTEYMERQALFQQRSEEIEAQNADPNRLWTAGINHLTDLTETELARRRGWRYSPAGSTRGGLSLLSEKVQKVKRLAAEVKWDHLKSASRMMDQQGCGSCWAVATTSMMEARYEAHTNNTREFSAQQLVNCVQNPHSCGGEGGCQGATVELALAYVEKAGLEDTSTVPYKAEDSTCEHPVVESSQIQLHQNKLNGGHRIGLTSWQRLPENEALPLMHAIMQGPVAVSVGANSWQLYSTGIFDGCRKNTVVNHAVTLYGYGAENDVNYWNIRNSWGNTWGEKGFIRVKREATPEEDEAYCGTDPDPSAGVACKPYPKTQRVCGHCGILFDSVVANFEEPSAV